MVDSETLRSMRWTCATCTQRRRARPARPGDEGASGATITRLSFGVSSRLSVARDAGRPNNMDLSPLLSCVPNYVGCPTKTPRSLTIPDG